MKQTNNAIKFLMAQYRAIFKHAYLKGLASAVVLTTALAAGASNASATTLSVSAANGDVSAIFSDTTLASGSGEFVGLSQDFTASGSGEQTWNADLTLVNDGTNSGSLTIFSDKDDLTIGSGAGVLTVGSTTENASGSGTFTLEASGGFGASLNLGTLNVVSGSVNLKGTSGTVVLNTTDALNINGGKFNLESTAGAVKVNSQDIKITDGTVTISGSGSTYAATFGTETSTITLDSGSIVLDDSSGAAGSVLNGNLTTTEGKKGGSIIFSGTNGGTLQAYTTNDTGAAITLQVGSNTYSGSATVDLSNNTDAAHRTLTIAEGGKIDVQSGSMIIQSSNAKDAGATNIVIGSGAALKIGSGSVTLSGSAEHVTTLTLEKGAALQTTVSGNSNDYGLTVGKNTILEAYADQLGDDATNFVGFVEISASGTLALQADDGNVVLNDIAFSGSKANKAVSTASGSIITGTNFVLDGSKTKVDVADGTILKGNTLTVKSGSSSGTQSSGDFVIATALEFSGAGATLQSDVELGTSGANTVNADQKFKGYTDNQDKIDALLGQSGNISGDAGVISGSTTTIVNGTWTTANNITVSGDGTLAVGAGSDAAGLVEGNSTAAKLVIGNGQILNLNGGTLEIGADNENLLYAGVDLTGATLEQTNSTINVNKKGELTISADQAESILITGTGAKVNVDSGTLTISGDVKLNVSNFSGAEGVGAINIAAGDVIVDGNLTLAQSGSDSKANADFAFGAGSLTVNDFKFGNQTLTTANSGFLNVNGSITSSVSNSTLKVANTLNLGDAENLSGASSIPAQNIGVNLTASGSSSNINVNAGQWTASGKTLTISDDGTVTVGQAGSTIYKDAAGNAITASLTADALESTVTSSNKGLNINQYGSASFTTAKTTGSTGAYAVNMTGGSLTIAGKAVKNANNENKLDYGISLGKASINVGQNSTLNFGADATSAITVNQAAGTTSGSVTVQTNSDESATFAEGAIILTGGLVTFEFDGAVFDADSIADLRKDIFGVNSGTVDGRIDLGNAKIEGLEVGADGTIAWEDFEGYSDILLDIQTTETSNAVVTGITSESKVQGNVGALQTKSNSDVTINIQGDTSLQSAASNDGKFATTPDGTLVELVVSDNKTLELINNGEAGDISLGKYSSLKTSSGDIVVASIDGDSGSAFEAFASNTTVKGNAEADVFTTDATSTLTVNGNLTTETGADESVFNGDLTVVGDATFNSAVKLAGSNTVFEKNVALNQGGEIFGDTKANSLTAKADVVVGGDAQLTADAITLAENTSATLFVGQDTTATQSGSTGYLQADKLTLNGGNLVIDPDYNENTSIAAVKLFGAPLPQGTLASGGLVDGNIYLAQNSALMIGKDASVEAMQQMIAQYQVDGHLVQDNIGAVLALNSKIALADGKKLIIDPASTGSDIKSNTYQHESSSHVITPADMYLGSGAALMLNNGVYEEGAAIEFKSDKAAIVSDGGKIILAGDKFLNSNTVTLFTDAGGTGHEGVQILGEDIEVESLNGLLGFTLKADGTEQTGAKLEFKADKADQAFTGASSTVRQNLLAYVSKTQNFDEYFADPANVKKIALIDDLADSKYATIQNGEITLTQAATDKGLTKDDFVIVDNKLYNRADNDYLDDVTFNSTSGIEGDQAARLAAFGGAAQAALSAGATTYEAIAGRMGVGAQTGSITFADNGQGAGLWITPVYKNQDSDSFSAQGLGYGVDMDLYGLSLGADFTLQNGFRVGAAFNVGSGDADGQGAASGVSNDFDYYGFAVYGGFTYDKLSIVGDISYTVVDNDLEVSNFADKLTASTDTTNLSVGVTGQYGLNYNGLDITPHAGLRYTYIDMDDYTVNGAKYGEISHFAANSFNVFSIPVGVTFSKDFTAGEWTVKPALDLTLTANMGDDSIEGNVTWNGVSNMNCNVESEVLDDWTYGATLGIAAKSGNLSFGLGVNYTGASNADSYGVSANARFVF